MFWLSAAKRHELRQSVVPSAWEPRIDVTHAAAIARLLPQLSATASFDRDRIEALTAHAATDLLVARRNQLAEAGCLRYEVGINDNPPDSVPVAELWAAEKAHQASLERDTGSQTPFDAEE